MATTTAAARLAIDASAKTHQTPANCWASAMSDGLMTASKRSATGMAIGKAMASPRNVALATSRPMTAMDAITAIARDAAPSGPVRGETAGTDGEAVTVVFSEVAVERLFRRMPVYLQRRRSERLPPSSCGRSGTRRATTSRVVLNLYVNVKVVVR